jgi:SAM-dependent methyltransferase
MLAQAERLTANAAISDRRFAFKQVENGIIPLETGFVDAAISVTVLQEIQTLPALGKTLAEIGRVIREGGEFVGIVPNDLLTTETFVSVDYAPYPENKTRKDNIRVCKSTEAPIVWEKDRHYTKAEYTQCLSAAGFEVLSMEYPLTDPAHPPYPDRPEIPWKGRAPHFARSGFSRLQEIGGPYGTHEKDLFF